MTNSLESLYQGSALDRLREIETRCAQLTTALRELLELTDEVDGKTPVEEQRHLSQDLLCGESGHEPRCPVTRARIVLRGG